MKIHNILLIEDETVLLDSLKVILQLNNYNPILAENGTTALKILNQQSNEIDLIVCDINLPDISGFDILQKIKSNSAINSIPFIFLTAYADAKDIQKGLRLGADEYLTKPFSSKELVNVINKRLLENT
jgi:two-component system, sensor histidine kinase and response regulator